ncbi:MAG: S-layer homology domain-containing protein [Almyronema sp.]
MSHSPQEPPSNRSPLDFDELLAVVISLLTVGLILLFGLSRRGTQFSLVEGFQTQPSDATPSEADSALREREAANDALNNRDMDDPTAIGPATGDRPFGLFPAQLGNLGRQSNVIDDEAEAEIENQTTIIAQPTDTFDANTAATDRTPPPLPAQRNGVEREVSEPLEFSDVPEGYWAAAFIDRLSSRQIISGFTNGTFRPEQPVTRAELATQITNAFAASSRQEAIAFSDIPADYWAAQTINQAVESGFMKGYPENTFQPEQSVPRVQVLAAIASGLGLEAPDDAEAILASTFSDADAIPNWAVGQMAAALEAGLIVNHPNTAVLEPNQDASRAEVAAILNQALVYSGELESVSSPYLVTP